MKRETYILRALYGVAGGSAGERNNAIARLKFSGFSDEEITDALRAEAVRLAEQLAEQRNRLDALSDHIGEVASQHLTQHDNP